MHNVTKSHTQTTQEKNMVWGQDKMLHMATVAAWKHLFPECDNHTNTSSSYATTSYGTGSTSSGFFPLVFTICPGRGPTGCRLQMTFSPRSFAPRFFSSFSFTLRRKSSRQRECFTCSIRTLMRFWMIRFLWVSYYTHSDGHYRLTFMMTTPHIYSHLIHLCM